MVPWWPASIHDWNRGKEAGGAAEVNRQRSNPRESARERMASRGFMRGAVWGWRMGFGRGGDNG